MTLHYSKRNAILHWFNSFSNYDLSKITHLADGKLFCDIISSVFNKIPNFPSKHHSTSIDSTSTSDPIIADVNEITPQHYPKSTEEINYETELIDVDAEDEINLGANDSTTELTQLTDNDVKIKTVPTIEFDSNSETEPYPFDVDTTDDSEAAKIEKEVKYIQGELSKVLVNKSDASDVEDNKENKSVVNKEDISGDKVPLVEKIKSKSKSISTTELVSKNNEKKSFELEVIAQRFDFVKTFIDEMYTTESENFVDYPLCMKSNELELAKVGIFILSLVVRQCLKSNNKEQLDTLTLLEIKIQEDIQECLSMLLQGEKFSKKEINRILTNPAKYKSSPRKSPRFSTPGRNHSRRKNSSFLTMTMSHEDIFTDSPLKSFLDSPQLKKALISKDLELVKAHKIIHVEELRSEELQLEINHMKKKLEDKDIEINKLKSEMRELKSKEEILECERCFDLINELKSAKREIKECEEDILRKDKLYEEENCKLTHEVTMLEGKVKCLLRKQNESTLTLPDNVVEVVKIKDEEINSLKALNSKLKVQLEEMLRNYSFVQSRHQSLKTEDEEKDESVLPLPQGECIGSIIEEENKNLRQTLLHVQKNLDNLFRKWDIKEKIVMDFKNNLNFSIINETKFLDSSSVLEIAKTPSFKELNTINLSKSIDSNSSVSCPSTPKEINPCQLPPVKKRKSSSSAQGLVSPCAFGSLWAQYNDSNADSDISQSHFPDSTKIDLFKQLGFNEADYPMKIEIVKKFLTSLKELFYPNGSNGLNNFPALGDLDEKLKSEEDCLKCLLCVREALLKFQTDTPVSLTTCETNVNEATEKTVCCCDIKSETIDHLQKENEKLTVNLSKTKLMCSAELDEKITELREISSQLEAAEHKNQELLKIKEEIEIQNKELVKKLEAFKIQVSKMSNKVSENNHIKKLYATLINEKNENEEKYRKQIKLCREKMLNFDIQKRQMQATIEKEKMFTKEIVPQIELFKNEIVTLKIQRKNLDKHIKDLKSQNKELILKNESLKEKMMQEKRSHEKIISIYTSNARLTHPQGEKDTIQNVYNINLEGSMQNGNKLNIELEQKTFQPSSAPTVIGSSNYAIMYDNAPPESCHESSMSNSVFNKSVHHGSLMLFTDDEEGFLNHSSISGIKKDFQLPNKGERIQELTRRNTLCLPHMKSSYSVELQNMSPFNASLYEHIKRTPRLGRIKSEDESESLSGEQSVKKRKISELEQQTVSASGPSNAITASGPSNAVPATPDTKMRKTFKTPASLKKLLHYRRKQKDPAFPKAKC